MKLHKVAKYRSKSLSDEITRLRLIIKFLNASISSLIFFVCSWGSKLNSSSF